MRVFLSYRRADAEAEARSLEQRLMQMPDISKVFLDHETIPKGADFSEAIRKAIRKAGVVLVLIGEDWRGADEAGGTARILEDRDFVRLEVSEALGSKRRVVPVLLNETRMPAPHDLPADVRDITRINAARIRMEDFEEDVDDLLDVVFGARHRVSRWLVPRLTWLRALRLTLYGILAAVLFTLIFAMINNSVTGGGDMVGLLETIFGKSADPLEDRGYLILLIHILIDVAIIGALSPFIYRNLKRMRRRG